MRRRHPFLAAGVAPAAAAVAAAAALAPAAAAAPIVRAKPGLLPRFADGVPDYVVRCRKDEKVRFSVDAPDGTRVAIGDREPHSGSFGAKVHLQPGERVVVTVIRDSHKRRHSVRCLPHDFRQFSVERHGHPQAAFLVVTPDLHSRTVGYAAIFDRRGVPVWWRRENPPPYNAELLPDGNLAWIGWALTQASDPYVVRRLDGTFVRQFAAVGEDTNQHELKPTPDGGALLLAYPIRSDVDLSRFGGPKHANVFDGEVQKIGADGQLRWSWSTFGHVALSETKPWAEQLFEKTRPVELPDGRKVYDIVHANSIEPDGSDFVVSLRHTNAVYGVDRASGDVRWKLGGTKTSKSLTLDGGHASRLFDGQHDARLLDGGRTLTVFDNGTIHRRAPRALEIRIDRKARTARLVHAIRFDRPGIVSTCCGSARRLPGGDWVMSWGNTPWVTEQTRSGQVRLKLTLGESGTSYRAQPVMPGQLSASALRRGMDAMAP